MSLEAAIALVIKPVRTVLGARLLDAANAFFVVSADFVAKSVVRIHAMFVFLGFVNEVFITLIAWFFFGTPPSSSA